MSTISEAFLLVMLAVSAAACQSESTAPAEDKAQALRNVLIDHTWRLEGPCSEGLPLHSYRFDATGKVVVFERISDSYDRSTRTPYTVTVNDAGVLSLVGIPPCGSAGDVVVYSYNADTVRFYRWMLVRTL
ncbi:MAG: hypothetical protein FGM24_04460 [Candidatus Kapabacteria bacterium]|nr:hypothetical protein [Candidatus Kapabacteria bacterium]